MPLRILESRSLPPRSKRTWRSPNVLHSSYRGRFLLGQNGPENVTNCKLPSSAKVREFLFITFTHLFI
jgi:hypothetical protein